MDFYVDEGENQINKKKRDVYVILNYFIVVLSAYFNAGRRISEQRCSQYDRNQ